MKRSGRKHSGFTLIELMIVVAVIGILAAIAYPSYQNSIIKGNRANAQAFLMEVAQRQQQYLLDNRAYGNLSALGLSVPADVGRYYSVTAVPGVSNGRPIFTVTADAIAGGRQAEDGDLTINESGQKTPADKW